MNTKKKILGIGALVLISTAVIALSVNVRSRAMVKKPVAGSVAKAIVYDTVLLKKFSGLLQTLDFNRPKFSYAGKFNISDGQDSSANIHDLPFLFCRAGKVFYSKVGSNEVLNDGRMNIYIENENKKVVVSSLAYQINPALSNLSQLISKARSEQYELLTSVSGSVEKISLLNEHHVACKELSVAYDTLSQKVAQITLRYSAISDPQNRKKDRKVEIAVGQTEYDVHMGDYPSVKDIVKEINGQPVLRSKYATFELITL